MSDDDVKDAVLDDIHRDFQALRASLSRLDPDNFDDLPKPLRRTLHRITAYVQGVSVELDRLTVILENPKGIESIDTTTEALTLASVLAINATKHESVGSKQFLALLAQKMINTALIALIPDEARESIPVEDLS